MRKFLSVFVLLFLTAGSAHAAITTPDLLRCTNAVRTANHVKPLRLNALLNRAAVLRELDMRRYKYFDHQNPITGKYPFEFIDQVGYDYMNAGENLAQGFVTAQGVCTAWEKSPLHKKNLIDPLFVDVGFAVMDGKVVELFGKR